MSKIFDDIKNDYLNQEIPSSINKNIDNLLNNLPKSNKKQINKKYLKVASIVIIFSASVFLLSVNYKPIKASLISLFKQLNISTIVTDKSNEYIEEINNVIEIDNKFITVNEVIYSSKDVTFTYTIDTAFLGENSNSNTIQKLLSVDLANGLEVNKFYINNKAITPIEVSGACKLSESEDKIIGYQNIIVDSINDGDTISIDVNNFGLSSEKITINLKVNMKMTNSDIFELKDPIVKQNENAAISVEKVLRTPLITYVEYTLELNEALMDKRYLDADIVNEFGRSLYKNSGFDEKREFISKTKVKISRYLINSSEGINEINIIPMLKNSSTKAVSEVFIGLDTILPYTIDLEPIGSIIINSINQTNNSIVIDCNVNGINKDILINNINIAPSSMKEKLQNPNLVFNFNPIWMESESVARFDNLNDINNTTISFDTTGVEEELSIFYNKDLSKTDVLNDLIIKIKTK
ncbi:MAG: DUF4179 domain-containing protein [Clostridium sartagoforme]|nr:DUF4179 domain-containing protein [Clostridium sartagoforme]